MPRAKPTPAPAAPRPRIAEWVTVPFRGENVTVWMVAPGACFARLCGRYQEWALRAANLLLDDVGARELSLAASTIALAELDAALGPHEGPAVIPAGGPFVWQPLPREVTDDHPH